MNFQSINVGTSVGRRPPRRSRRAELPHRAPQECAQVELRSSLVSCCLTLSYSAWLALASSSWPRNLHHPWHRHLPALPRRDEGHARGETQSVPASSGLIRPPRNRRTASSGISNHTLSDRSITPSPPATPVAGIDVSSRPNTKRIKPPPVAPGMFNQTAQPKSSLSLSLRSTI
jgi:hypothetical protein